MNVLRAEQSQINIVANPAHVHQATGQDLLPFLPQDRSKRKVLAVPHMLNSFNLA